MNLIALLVVISVGYGYLSIGRFYEATFRDHYWRRVHRDYPWPTPYSPNTKRDDILGWQFGFRYLWPVATPYFVCLESSDRSRTELRRKLENYRAH